MTDLTPVERQRCAVALLAQLTIPGMKFSKAMLRRAAIAREEAADLRMSQFQWINENYHAEGAP